MSAIVGESMRLLIFSDTVSLEFETQAAVTARGWSLLSASSLKELEGQATRGVNVVLTNSSPPGANLPCLAAELQKWKPVPSLFIGVLEEERPTENLEQHLNLVDRVIVVSKNATRDPGEGKIRYCRADAFGETIVREIEFQQNRSAAATAPETGEKPAPSTPGGREKAQEAQTALPRDMRVLLESTCPYPHRSVPAAQARMDSASKNKKLFVDTLNADCIRPVQRCPACNVANRTFARHCRYCGSPVDFSLLEESQYQTLKLDANSLKCRSVLDAIVSFGMSSINTFSASRGFLWLGGTREDGMPLLTGLNCEGDLRTAYPVPSDVRPDEVLGIEAGEVGGLPVLVLTTRRAVHRLDLQPRVKLRNNILTASEGCDFKYPAVIAGETIVVLEHARNSDTYFLRAGTTRKGLGKEVSPLLTIASQRVLLCTSRKIWLFDEQSGDVKAFDANREIDVDHRIAYDKQRQRAYIKGRDGVCVVRLDQERWWLDLRVPTTQSHYAFCLSRRGDFLWVHDLNYICRYSSFDFQADFDSRSSQWELPFIGKAPVEQGGILFVSTASNFTHKQQVGILDPDSRRASPYLQIEDVKEIVLPPLFNMGAAFLPVRDERERLCLKRYLS